MTAAEAAARPFGARAIARAWALLGLRPAALLGAQALVAAVLAATGAAEPWWSSAAWWPVAGVLGNVVCGAALVAAARADGTPLRDLVAPGRWRRGDAWVAAPAAAALVALALAVPPWIAARVYADPSAGTGVLSGPLPAWVAWAALLLFPLTTALVELPTFAGYVRPRLAATRLGPAGAALLVGAVAGAQLAALPFLPARTFVAWRVTMLVPYALAALALVTWRPRLLPAALLVSLGLSLAAVVPLWLAST